MSLCQRSGTGQNNVTLPAIPGTAVCGGRECRKVKLIGKGHSQVQNKRGVGCSGSAVGRWEQAPTRPWHAAAWPLELSRTGIRVVYWLGCWCAPQKKGRRKERRGHGMHMLAVWTELGVRELGGGVQGRQEGGQRGRALPWDV